MSDVDDRAVLLIAEAASADPRSVVRRLAGLPVRGKAGRRIDVEIARHREGTLGRPSRPDPEPWDE